MSVASRLQKAGFHLDMLLSHESSGELPRLRAQLGEDVRWHTGRSDAVDFGLSGSEYLELASRVTVAVCLELPPPPSAKGAIARSAAREIVELGLVCPKIEQILVLSHVDVCGEMDGTFGEHDLAISGATLGLGQEDRRGAERIFRRFYRQLPLTILRSGWIVGRQAGMCPLAHLLLALDSPEELGPSFSGIELNLVSLEDLSRIAACLVEETPPLRGRTLHIVGEGLPPNLPMLHADVVGLSSGVIPAGFDRGAGARRAIKRDTQKREWFVQEFFRHQPRRARITTAYTRGVLSQRGIAPPVFTEDWLEDLVNAASEEILGFQ
jgi:hypothetical protein